MSIAEQMPVPWPSHHGPKPSDWRIPVTAGGIARMSWPAAHAYADAKKSGATRGQLEPTTPFEPSS